MATTRRTRFSRRLPDHVTDELVTVLSTNTNFLTFHQRTFFFLFTKILKKKNAVSGGEEMLRLRAYEKLQNLVNRGLVEKSARTYKGLKGLEKASSAAVAAAQAEAQAKAEAEAEAEAAK